MNTFPRVPSCTEDLCWVDGWPSRVILLSSEDTTEVCFFLSMFSWNTPSSSLAFNHSEDKFSQKWTQQNIQPLFHHIILKWNTKSHGYPFQTKMKRQQKLQMYFPETVINWTSHRLWASGWAAVSLARQPPGGRGPPFPWTTCGLTTVPTAH